MINIADMVIDVLSRDDIPLLLLGLQHIHCTQSLREEIFKILTEVAPSKQEGDNAKTVSLDKGRPAWINGRFRY